MLNNHIYNLITQLTEEHKSLWRIKNEYLTDADNCNQCAAWWKKMAEDKEAHVTDLLGMIKNHLS